jgi:peptide/nickel transport system permease protein
MSGQDDLLALPAGTRRTVLRSEPEALNRDLIHSFCHSSMTIISAIVVGSLILAAVLAPWIAPHDPFDLRQLNLLDSHVPPAWLKGGDTRFLLGTDDQGRDILSAILYGLRLSLTVGALAAALAAFVGVMLGLIAGYSHGKLDSLVMRVADVQLTFPAILIALLIDGTLRAINTDFIGEQRALWVLVLSISLSYWVQYARVARVATLVEAQKDYVLAARLIGIRPPVILFTHILPNVIGPVLVILTINLAFAIILEATLSFLGVGLPPTQPSLGTLIRVGNNFLFSGEWWMAVFPSIVLAALVVAFNVIGDWLRDALNPKLR